MTVEGPSLGIVVLSGACCIPGLAPLDREARGVLEQAIAASGVRAEVTVVPVSTAYVGGTPQPVIAALMTHFQKSGRLALPAIVVNGQVIAHGVPELAALTAALRAAAAGETSGGAA